MKPDDEATNKEPKPGIEMSAAQAVNRFCEQHYAPLFGAGTSAREIAEVLGEREPPDREYEDGGELQ